MAEKYDYYQILGVERTATADEIKAAYRRMAKKYHPDLFSTKPEEERRAAEEQFKKINHAYDVLSDPQKRAAYDQYGDENGPMGGGFGGGSGDPGGDFGGFGDIFSEILNAFGGGGNRRRSPNDRIPGDDISATVTIDFMEAVKGIQKDIQIMRQETCADCHGTGAKNGTAYKTCSRCGGRGHVQFRQNTMFGQQVIQSACPDCRGAGRIISDYCKTCGGKGVTRQSRVIHANIPAGIDNGQVIRFRNEGHCGRNGGERGNFVLKVNVTPHPLFTRKEFNIYFDVPISYMTAALGGEIDVPTLDGTVKYKIPEGTSSGTVFRLAGKGIPKLSKSNCGDLYFTVRVQTPTGLSRQQKELLSQFEKTLTPNQTQKQKSFEKYTNRK